MHTRAKAIILGIIVLGVGLALMWNYELTPAPPAEAPMATVDYACKGGNTITAVYYKGVTIPGTPEKPPVPGGEMDLTLSDGRAMTLSQTISADGMRYANADESFVFWSKGEGALVLENNQEQSYIGCIAVAPDPGGLPEAYWNGAAGITLRLPNGYSAAPYAYTELRPKKSISGIKFGIASSTWTGTNLGQDTYISVEEIPQTRDCTAALFLEHAAAHSVTDGTTAYSVASSTGAAAGNRYEETVYAVPGTNPCIAVRYWIHYGVFQNYAPGMVTEFNKQALLDQFDAIRRTLTVVQ